MLVSLQPLFLFNWKRFYRVPVPAWIRSSEQEQIFLWWSIYKCGLSYCFLTDTVRRLTRKDWSDGAITSGVFFNSGSINILNVMTVCLYCQQRWAPSLWIEWGLQLIWLKPITLWEPDLYTRGHHGVDLITKTFVIWWHEDDVLHPTPIPRTTKPCILCFKYIK